MDHVVQNGRLVDNELDGISKEAIMAKWKQHYGIFLDVALKT
jgi:hypothetical protein